MAPRTPTGIQDFRKLREGGYYYVDKTDLICRLLDDGAEAYLFTRPRRFGKSLNLSMLDSFFNIRYAEEARSSGWFDGLEVSERRDLDVHRNVYPVVHMDFKQFDSPNIETFMTRVRNAVSVLCREHAELLDSPNLLNEDKRDFDSYLTRSCSDADLVDSLGMICRMLEKHHGKKVIVLLDEYDNPVNNSSDDTQRRGILDFISSFMSSALKGNPSLKMGVVTGIMQISKESIFSELNNLVVNNIFSNDSNELYGFTPSEVQDICRDYGHPEMFDEAKEWYDGYRFGGAEIYNPWSILNYVKNGFKPGTYWAGTSGNSIMADLLDVADDMVWRDLEAMGNGGTVTVTLDPRITYSDLDGNPRTIYAIMVMSGYLSAIPHGSMYDISIPNAEMYEVFGKSIVSRIGGKSESLGRFTNALLVGDVGAMESSLHDLLMDVMSSRVLDREHSYQAFFAGAVLSLLGRYRISVDKESGDGFHGILLERVRGNGANVVLELKRSNAKKNETLIAHANRALDQIKTRSYYHDLKGDTILYGIVFKGKEPTIVSERVIL